MKGYNTLKQYIQDYKLYRAAKKIDPGRNNGETITLFLKKRVDERLNCASKRFKTMIKKRNYSVTDLMLIATHDTVSYIDTIEFFIKECFGVNYASPLHYKKVLSSNAFKTGRLKRLYDFIPHKIQTKNDFIRFLKSRRQISKAEFSVIMNQVCRENWRKWLDELIDKNKIQHHNGRWVI